MTATVTGVSAAKQAAFDEKVGRTFFNRFGATLAGMDDEAAYQLAEDILGANRDAILRALVERQQGGGE